MKKHNKTKYVSRLLLVICMSLHAFSFMVCYTPIFEYVSNYILYKPLAQCVSIVTLILIELSVHLLVENSLDSLTNNTHAIDSYIIHLLCVLFICVSATLTTKGASIVVVNNMKEVKQEQKTEIMQILEKQISQDNKTIRLYDSLLKQREYLTKDEHAEKKITTRRIEQNMKELNKHTTSLQEANTLIKEENKKKKEEKSEKHGGFGFITQVLLVLCVVCRHELEKQFENLENNVLQGTNHENKQEQYKISKGITHTIINQRLKNPHLTSAKIAEIAQVSKSKVTQVLQNHYLQQAPRLNEDERKELQEKLNLKDFKGMRTINTYHE